ncbi:hypothetical protein [Sporosarcina sp. FSL K6-2383]|uniref:hypothetical protein n=1 Tax=Sporosarcina sp. FSL K6-2383 TaxID=2921556 RepID=UPI00315B15F0
MDVFVGAEHERYAAELCLRVANQRLKENDVEMAIKRTEEALRSLKALQEIKKAD